MTSPSLITEKQLKYIEQLFIDILERDAYNKQKKLGLIKWADIERSIESLDELTRREASKLIEYLKDIKEQKKGPISI